jgi:hypothetical protein
MARHVAGSGRNIIENMRLSQITPGRRAAASPVADRPDRVFGPAGG